MVTDEEKLAFFAGAGVIIETLAATAAPVEGFSADEVAFWMRLDGEAGAYVAKQLEGWYS